MFKSPAFILFTLSSLVGAVACQEDSSAPKAQAPIMGDIAPSSNLHPNQAQIDAALTASLRVDRNQIAAISLTVARGDDILYSGAAGCAQFSAARTGNSEQTCLRPMTPRTKMRVASVSKMAVAFAMLEFEARGLIDLDGDISPYLGFQLRNPAYPQIPITARQLLAHTSSLRDPAAYWVAAPGRFEETFANAADIFAPAAPADAPSTAPGNYFKYANINYGFLATLLEKIANERFDRIITQTVSAPLGLDAAFNWSGLTADIKQAGATLYRAENELWRAQTDDQNILNESGPLILSEPNLDTAAYLRAYTPGENATLFSPQGGLRASTQDLITLLGYLRDIPADKTPARPVWQYDPALQNGDRDGGFFNTFGTGIQTLSPEETGYEARIFTGHAGEAYGLYSGAWLIRGANTDQDIRIAFALTGSKCPPEKGAFSGFNTLEEGIISLAMSIAQDTAP